MRTHSCFRNTSWHSSTLFYTILSPWGEQSTEMLDLFLYKWLLWSWCAKIYNICHNTFSLFSLYILYHWMEILFYLLGRISDLCECYTCWWPWKHPNSPFHYHWTSEISWCYEQKLSIDGRDEGQTMVCSFFFFSGADSPFCVFW